MEPTRRFSLLPFPQSFTNGTLKLNFVVLPRNQDPLQPANAGDPALPAFADAKLSFTAHLAGSLAGWPNSLSAALVRRVTTSPPAQARALFEALAKQFQITPQLTASDKAPDPVASDFPVRKYLPLSYRQAFNFTTPRTPAAVTDDSYHCAIRGAGTTPGFKSSSDEVSWGQVFAHALRQPLLAGALGMIYEATLKEIPAALFAEGGWLFISLADDSDFHAQDQADPDFIKKYAARIPPLKAGAQKRPLFAPILFPVVFKKNTGDPDPLPPAGNFDPLFLETTDYDDGFAKIVHAQQPPSRNLLAETSDAAKPVTDAGIRLGWDDEQILIWYLRQLGADETGNRLDAPLGVFGYAIDVRETGAPESAWRSLNEVASRRALTLPGEPAALSLGDFTGEFPYQVYPVQLEGNPKGDYWLPMYFANWTGRSMALPDKAAAEIYQTNSPEVAGGPARNRLNDIYQAQGPHAKLRYGHQYDFRVRLRDLSGGGPEREATPVNASASSVGRCHFRRFVAPNQPRVADLPKSTDALSAPKSLSINRPLISYPAVVYTGKYADPVALLKQASRDMILRAPAAQQAFGIYDPDVDRIEIAVEIETLRMDNLQSVSGRENYLHLYTTERRFPAVAGEEDYAATLEIPIVRRDVKVLHRGDELNLAADFGFEGNINDLAELYLPTARNVRLTLRSVCAATKDDADYYGLLSSDRDHEEDSRYGPVVELRLRYPATDERDLFVATPAAERLQGIYLQPDELLIADGNLTTALFGTRSTDTPDIVQRLAGQLGLQNNGLSLVPKKGERAQFGCSSRIRHTLAPDSSSLTFSSKGDLANHWLCCVQLTLDRDWTWDALAGRSFVIERTVHFTHDDGDEKETAIVGEIEVKRTASLESLHDPQRDYTRIIFIDAVEPKNSRTQKDHPDQPRFPDTIEVSYAITSHFASVPGKKTQGVEYLQITLPITTPPAQVPKIASAGLALSPYVRNEKYSASEPRRRFLWIEFAEPVRDPQDAVFARVLAYAPDQLLSKNSIELFAGQQETPLPIAPEPIRVVIEGASNDLAGLGAMQPMEKASDSDLHYLLPLPPGLHGNADEMFGFFTYEFRLGHYRHPAGEEADEAKRMSWTTARGRFGRPLRATGIQHPAPTLTCTVTRDEDKLWVSAPYAVAVFEGRNVTANPPRTQLWCLLYAQARQADNLDWRNILLDDKQLDWRIEIEDVPDRNRYLQYSPEERLTLRNLTVRNFKDDISYTKAASLYKLADLTKKNKDATARGVVAWSNGEISQLLTRDGLPENSALSVLVVEFFSAITNFEEAVSQPDQSGGNGNVAAAPAGAFSPPTSISAEGRQALQYERDLSISSPASDRLGEQRILRTSPLTEVPFVCCPQS